MRFFKESMFKKMKDSLLPGRVVNLAGVGVVVRAGRLLREVGHCEVAAASGAASKRVKRL